MYASSRPSFRSARRRRASSPIARYMAPVSRKSKPSRSATAWATVDLPVPAGPSIVMIMHADCSDGPRYAEAGPPARPRAVRSPVGQRRVDVDDLLGAGLQRVVELVEGVPAEVMPPLDAGDLGAGREGAKALHHGRGHLVLGDRLDAGVLRLERHGV